MTERKVKLPQILWVICAVALVLGNCRISDDGDKKNSNGWIATNGPVGGDITQLAVNYTTRADANEVYAVGRGGVFYSDDAGQSWTTRTSGLPEGEVQSLRVVWEGSGVLWAGVCANDALQHGFYYSSDGGRTWNKVNTGLQSDLSTDYQYTFNILCVIDSQIAYAVINNTSDGSKTYLYKTTDGGQSWVKKTLPSGATRVDALVARSSTQLYLLAVSDIYCTENSGDSWSTLSTPTNFSRGYSLAIQKGGSANTDKLLLGASAQGGHRLYRSTAGGTSGSWEPAMAESQTFSNAITSLAWNKDNENAVYVGIKDGSGLYYSSNIMGRGDFVQKNGGATSSPVVSSLAVAFGANSGNDVLYRGCPVYGVLFSNDSAYSFVERNVGQYGTTVNALVMERGSETNVAAATPSGLYFTFNGADWTRESKSLNGVYTEITAMASYDFNVFYVGTPGTEGNAVYRFVRNANTWTLEKSNFSSRLTSLAIASASSHVFAGTESHGVFFRDIATNLWTTPANSNLHPQVRSLAVSGDAAYLYAGTTNGVYFSSDKAANWAIRTPLNKTVQALVASTDGLCVFAGFNGDGFYYSNDRGQTWLARNSGLTTAARQIFSITVEKDALDKIYIGTNDGVWYSADRGVSWVSRSTSLPYSQVRVVVMATGDADVVYAGTAGHGVFKTTNGGR